MIEQEGERPQPENVQGETSFVRLVRSIQTGEAVTAWAALSPYDQRHAHLAILQLAITMESVLRGASVETLRERLEQLPGEEQRRHLFAAVEQEETLRDPLTGELTPPQPLAPTVEEVPPTVAPAALLAAFRATTDHLCTAVERLHSTRRTTGEGGQ